MSTLLRIALVLAVSIAAHAGPGWLTDPVKAKVQAQKENKAVFVEFTGSDWCPPCKKLKAAILESPVFQEYASKKLVLLEVDFPRQTEQAAELKSQNAKLKQRFKITGYPTVILLDKNSKELDRWVGFGGESPEEYIAKLEALLAKGK